MNHSYYWENEKEYPRLTIDELNNTALVKLVCQILDGIKDEINDILSRLGTPSHKAALRDAKNMEFRLRSEYLNGLTMGHSFDIWADFVEQCKRRTLGQYECARKDERIPKKPQS